MNRHARVFALVLAGGLLTLTDADFGRVSDGQAMLDVAVNLRRFGDLKIGYRVDPEAGFTAEPAAGGRYGIGYSLVEQIPVALAEPVERLAGMGSSNVLFPLTNLLLHALTAVAISAGLTTIGFSTVAATLAAVGWAFGTFAWPYVSYEFSEPLQALCVAAAFLFTVRAARRARETGRAAPADLLLAGSALGLAVLTKSFLAILVPPFALYVGLTSASRPAVRRLGAVGVLAIPPALAAALVAATNLSRFGSVLAFGYGDEATRFTTPLADGLYRLLLGPNRGLIFYAPLALLIPWGLARGWRTHRGETLLLCGALGLHLLAVGKWWSWEGGACWGPRLLLPVAPLAAILSAMVLDRARRWTAIFAGCLAAGILVNLLGVLLHFMIWPAGLTGDRLPLDAEGRPSREYQTRDGRKYFPHAVAVSYVPALSPILGHAWLLGIRYLDYPFPLWAAEGRGGNVPLVVDAGPLRYDFGLLRRRAIVDRLESADIWIVRLASGRGRTRAAAPAVALSYERLGNAATANGDLAKAAVCYRRALDLIPGRGELATHLARIQAGLGRPAEAIETLETFLVVRPDEASARLELGRLLEQQGDAREAREQYAAYLELPSGDDEGRRLALEGIRRIDEAGAAAQPRGVEPSQR